MVRRQLEVLGLLSDSSLLTFFSFLLLLSMHSVEERKANSENQLLK